MARSTNNRDSAVPLLINYDDHPPDLNRIFQAGSHGYLRAVLSTDDQKKKKKWYIDQTENKFTVIYTDKDTSIVIKLKYMINDIYFKQSRKNIS